MRPVSLNRLPTQHSNTPPQHIETRRPTASERKLTLNSTQVKERLARWVAAVLATLDGAQDSTISARPERRGPLCLGAPMGANASRDPRAIGPARAGTFFTTNERPSHDR
jgi:hypothetical protein